MIFSLRSNGIIGITLLIIGFILGYLVNTIVMTKDSNLLTHDDKSANVSIAQTTVEPVPDRPTSNQVSVTKKKHVSNIIKSTASTKSNNASYSLKNHNASDRLNALFQYWIAQKIPNYRAEINFLAKNDPDLRVRNFAYWLINQSTPASNNPVDNLDLRDSYQIDEALQRSLYKDELMFAQNNETPQDEFDLIEPLYSMTPEEQQYYIGELVDANEDSAVDALQELIFVGDSTIQQDAIEGLLTILENDTGYSTEISETLEYISGYLTEQQLARLHGFNHDQDKNL